MWCVFTNKDLVSSVCTARQLGAGIPRYRLWLYYLRHEYMTSRANDTLIFMSKALSIIRLGIFKCMKSVKLVD